MFEKIPGLIMKSETVGHIGKIENVVGMSMEASGGRSSIGDIVLIYNEEQNRQMPAEVVGFKDGRIQLMTYEATGGIASGSFVRNTRPVSYTHLDVYKRQAQCRTRLYLSTFNYVSINTLKHIMDENVWKNS